MPSSGWQARVGNLTFVFVDLDGDGALKPEVDGIGITTAPFIVPLPPVLLASNGQHEVSFDGLKSIVLKKQALGATLERAMADASVVTELRIRAGARCLTLDPKASAACEKHCDYLKANGMADGSGGMAVHEEKESKPGYSTEGETAGRKSCLAFAQTSLKTAILDWYATAWHGAPIVDPAVTRFATALKHGIAMFYPSEQGSPGARSALHPPDGATEVPLAFGSRGEIPNPVPGSRFGIGCGFPILMKLANRQAVLKAAIVKDKTGIAISGTASCPKNPATPDWPHNSGCAVFIPSVPLEPKTLYSVRFELEGAPSVEWSFTTAAK
jgi:hypothetical protein